MLQILSNSDTWVLNKEDVFRKSKMGRDRFETVWNHLKQLGFVEIVKTPMPDGKFQYSYIINEIPEVRNQDMVTEKPDTGFRGTENHSTEIRGTNNYYTTRTNRTNPATGVDPRNGVEGDTCQKILGPSGKIENVPTPSLRCGEGRDIQESQIIGSSTRNEFGDPYENHPDEEYFLDPVNNIPNEEMDWNPEQDIPTDEDSWGPYGVIPNEEDYLDPEKNIPIEEMDWAPEQDIATDENSWNPYDDIPTEDEFLDSVDSITTDGKNSFSAEDGIQAETNIRAYTEAMSPGKRMWSPSDEYQIPDHNPEVKRASKSQNEWVKEFTFPDDLNSSDLDEWEPNEDTINDFIAAIDELYKDDYPDWKKKLRKMPIHAFQRETRKVHGGTPEILEMISIIHRKLNGRNHFKKRT